MGKWIEGSAKEVPIKVIPADRRIRGIGAAADIGVAPTDSAAFITVKLSALTDGKIPYHVNDATGLADGPVKSDVDDAVTKKHAIGGDTTLGTQAEALNMGNYGIVSVGEISLTPKASSTGAEGTIFYCSDDNAVYVGTE